jgi:hypothetical protein
MSGLDVSDDVTETQGEQLSRAGAKAGVFE